MSYVGLPTRFLDFGAVKINSYPKPVPCTSNATFCQPTEQNDIIEFEFMVSESANLVANGDFSPWDQAAVAYPWIPGYWSRSNNKMCIQSPFYSGNYLLQDGILSATGYYRVTVTVSDRTQGNIIIGSSIGGSTIGTTALTASANGTFTGYFTNATALATSLLIKGQNDFDGCIDDISVIELTKNAQYTIEILDNDTGAVVDTVTNNFKRTVENLLVVQFSWADLSVTNGCRVIRISDSTPLFEDSFDTDPLLPWTLGDDVTISGGDMTFADTGASCLAPTGFDCGAEITALEVGRSYTITYTATFIPVGSSVSVFAGNTQGTSRTVNGAYTETLLCTGTDLLRFFFNGDGSGKVVEIDDISVVHADNIDGQSECYDLQDSHDCSLMFEWSNLESWGGFNYSSPATGEAFRQRLRLISKFRGTKYPSTRLIGENSGGLKQIDYTSLRKKKILDIDFAPDYIHDAMAAMWVQGTRTIDGDSYILDDEYEPSSPSDSRVLFKDMMTARLELEKTDQPNQINRT